MISNKIFKLSASVIVCSFLLTAGCGGPGTDLALKFVPQDTTTYKLITAKEDSITFSGPELDAPEFKDKTTSSRIEMTFTRQIEEIDSEGNAVVKITIKELKYDYVERNEYVFSFDSTSEGDLNNPLAKLTGRSYTLKISPGGKVVKIIDTKKVKAVATKGKTSIREIALQLFSPESIKQRHEVPGLAAAGEKPLRIDAAWSVVQDFNFGLMGSKSYEKIYTLKEVTKTEDGRQTAIVEMSAIPTTETAEELHDRNPAPTLSKMFDNVQTYTGRLKMDLTDGKVEEYTERLQTEWFIADPMAKLEKGEEPTTMTMIAIRSTNLERIE